MPTAPSSNHASSANTGRTLLVLAALTVAAPFNAAVVLAALAASRLKRRGTKKSMATRKTVLISGGKMTKALQLARSFHAAGHRVVLIESHKYGFTGHRFSNAVDLFLGVPESGAPDYADALLDIVRREAVDIYVPVCSPVSSLHDSEAIPMLSPHCDVMHVAPDRIMDLDDKHRFAVRAAEAGLAVPKTFRVADPEAVLRFDFSEERRPYILKSIAYDAVRRLDLTKLPGRDPEAMAAFVRSLPISQDNPWILQEFIRGTEYCTHGTMRNGELRVHCCCLSSAFQINYADVDKPEIEQWVRRFSQAIALTGQASFDFIEADDDGRIYAIECNPRTHSAITMFYDHPGLSNAYLDEEPLPAPVRPLAGSRPTYWLYHEVWRLITGLTSLRATRERLGIIAEGKDAVFDWSDPLPFLMLHHWHIPRLLLRDLRQRRGWVRIDFNIGKLVQAGGD